MTGVAGRPVVAAIQRPLLMLTVACAAGGPYPWADVRPLAAPAEAEAWWWELEQCSGRTGDFRGVRWYAAPGSFLVINDQLFDGYWSPQENAVVFPEAKFEELARYAHVVRHELLHALLQRPGHPGEFFRRRCRALVERPR